MNSFIISRGTCLGTWAGRQSDVGHCQSSRCDGVLHSAAARPPSAHYGHQTQHIFSEDHDHDHDRAEAHQTQAQAQS